MFIINRKVFLISYLDTEIALGIARGRTIFNHSLAFFTRCAF